MPQETPRPGAALFERLFGRPTAGEAEEKQLRTLFELLGSTLQHRGEDYLSALAVHLSGLLDVEMCWITRLESGAEPSSRMIAVARGGEAQAGGGVYALAGTPCEFVAQGSIYFVDDGVATSFPRDTFLAKHGMRSYLGIPLWGENEEVIGKICMLDTKPMPDAALARELCGMFVQRVSAEVERVQARAQARAADAMLGGFLREFPGWVCAYQTSADPSMRKVLLSSGGADALIGPRHHAELLEDATRFNLLLHPAERDQIEHAYDQARESRTHYELEYRIRHDDGHYRWVQVTGRFTEQDDGTIVGHSLMLDREAYHALQRRHEELLAELETLVRAFPDAVFLQDHTGRVRFLNRAAERLFGLQADQLIGHSFATLAERFPDFADIFLRAHSNTFQAFQGRKPVQKQVRRVIPGTQEPRDFETQRIPVLDDADQPSAMVTIVRDVTARVAEAERAEEVRQLRERAARLSSLSRLVEGVSHELENQLTAVLGYAEVGQARLRHPDDSTTEELLERSFRRIHGAAQSASELVRKLLAFGSSTSGASEPCQPAVVLERAKSFLENELCADYAWECVLSGQDDPHRVRLTGLALRGIVVELVRNAVEASPAGAKIRLEAGPGESESGEAEFVLRVTDQGSGVPTHLRERAFDPLFSTRESTQRRRGFGLSIAHRTAVSAGGSLCLVSPPESRETVFELRLPWVQEEVDAAQRGHAGPPTVLIIEDQSATREIVCEVLRAAGYQVIETEGREAAAALDANTPTPDLILADVLLEDGTGTELADALQARWPHARTLLCSGLPAEHLSARGIELKSDQAFLQKPFRPTELLTVVRDLVGAPPAPAPSQG